ncbi:hypothetical protein ACFVH6_05230 [Spirillospora sp. NPDC127200]
MIELTDDFLQPEPGSICYWPGDLDHPLAGTWNITIPLKPFSADDWRRPATFRPGPGGPELVTTEISLDDVRLPATDLEALSRRTFTFPVNPEDGYIDGSVYLVAAHCPVDVTRIEFGPAGPDHITATFHARFEFGAAGSVDIHDRAADLKATLHFELGGQVS